MRPFTSVVAAIVTAAFLTVAIDVSAQDANLHQRTYLTFSKPVQLPGITLPAGTYLFRLAQGDHRNVVQVLDSRGQHFYGQWPYVDKYRTEADMKTANDKPVVIFAEAEAGMPPAIQSYFYPAELIGKEFIYPKREAVAIAKALVPAAPPVAAAPAPEPEPQPAATTGTEPEQPVATTGTEQPQQTATELPRTASPLGAISLMGLFALVGAFSLRLTRRAH